jgi:uncharacterized protein (TIGR00369 family)
MSDRTSDSCSLPPDRHRALVDWFERGIPFNRHLGLRVDALERGRCVLRIPWQDCLIGDPGRPAVHGGVTSMLADTAGGAACFAMLDDEADRVSTVDLRVDYLRPGGNDDLVCTAVVVRMGNRVAVARMEVHCGSTQPDSATARPIATGQGVYNIVRRGGSIT